MKQKELADALGISPSHLNEIEAGKKQVTMEVLQKYADFFRIPPSSLLYFAERKGKPGPKSNSSKAHPIAAKALKMLDWIETITREDENEEKVSS